MNEDQPRAATPVRLPRYQCHKSVSAAKILSIDYNACQLTVEYEPEPIVLHMGSAFMQKHQPFVGGYVVFYDDGYQSYSPALAFESGYSKIDWEGSLAPV